MLEKVFIIALSVMALWACCLEGMIFGFIRKVIDEDSYLAKPYYSCPICMCAWWGSPLYLYLFQNEWRGWWFIVLAAMGVNTVFVKLFPEKN